MMERCKHCKWWTVIDWNKRDHYVEANVVCPVDQETWTPNPVPFEMRRCESPKLKSLERPPDPSGACVVDGEDFYASLCTGPEFGCVNFEPADGHAASDAFLSALRSASSDEVRLAMLGRITEAACSHCGRITEGKPCDWMRDD